MRLCFMAESLTVHGFIPDSTARRLMMPRLYVYRTVCDIQNFNGISESAAWALERIALARIQLYCKEHRIVRETMGHQRDDVQIPPRYTRDEAKPDDGKPKPRRARSLVDK
jgi:hypothetical protein